MFGISCDQALNGMYTFVQTAIYTIDEGLSRETPRVINLRATLLNWRVMMFGWFVCKYNFDLFAYWKGASRDSGHRPVIYMLLTYDQCILWIGSGCYWLDITQIS